MVSLVNGQANPVTSDTTGATQQAQSGKRSHGGHHRHHKAAGSGQIGTEQSSGQTGTGAQTNSTQGNANPDVIVNLSAAAATAQNNGG
jgi:hypothetical protein